MPAYPITARARDPTDDRKGGGESSEGGSVLTRDVSSLDYAQRAQAFRNHERKGDENSGKWKKGRPVTGPGDKREYTGANKSAVWI